MPSFPSPDRASRVFACLIAMCIAAVAHADGGARLSFDDARHLLARTGFGPTPAEVHALEGRTRAEAVDALLAGAPTTPTLAPPTFTLTSTPSDERAHPGMSQDERKALRQHERTHVQALRSWWLAEMCATDSPLTERMTLFWHDHFATGVQKVRDARLMYQQNALFRHEALGNFATLLHAVAKDPAMLVWLDGGRNREGAPNENFAREAMELFTLGEGHYTQADVADAARAFTGFVVDRANDRALYRPRRHDDGEKTMLGVHGRLDADGAIDVLLARPETATFIVTKLWREFVSPAPDAHEVARIADAFRTSHYDIKTALRTLLLSDAFWDTKNRGTLVKSPVELVVGTLRVLRIDTDDLRPAVVATNRMGEALFAPPNVRGWPGGDAWITSATLLVREQFIGRVTREAWGAMTSEPMKAKSGEWQHVLLALPPVSAGVAEATAERDPAAELRAAMLDPVYELK
ncbi:MAG TPA: DUF1800 domain-containing protein [Casimicrobiaceae bacterium]|nr:DUF1800 domain-containing protein [Casimicrobiaceae bacterium]